MRLSPAKFNRHLDHMGQEFGWRRGYACPCINPASGQPKHNCPSCDGKGRVWPDDYVQGKAGVVSQSRLRNYAQFGPWDSDDILLSIQSNSPLYKMGQFDRVLAGNRSEPFSIALVRGLNERISFPVLSVDRVFYLDADNRAVDTSIPTVLDDGTLEWNGQKPPGRVSYSITGRRRPEYYCYLALPTDRPMHSGQPLPRRVILRRFDLFERG